MTTVVDAGSSGWRNFGEFSRSDYQSPKTRVFAMLNIVGSGMGGRPDVEQNTQDMDPERTAEVARRHSDVVVGIKVAHYAGPEWIAVDRGVEAGKLANYSGDGRLRHVSSRAPVSGTGSEASSPGRHLHAHLFVARSPCWMGRPRAAVPVRSRKRGIIFDVGHGGGSFSFPPGSSRRESRDFFPTRSPQTCTSTV